MGILSKKQRLLLESNINVERTTASHVVYKPSFKLKALKLNEEGFSAVEIFSEHGLNHEFFNEHYFKTCIKRWKRIAHQSGEKGLSLELRGRSYGGGRPKKEIDIKTLSISDLQALVQVQQEVIEELKKRKALVRKNLK